jgi:pimeloyl-ACP methyl ester carboxylesterase
VRAALLEGPVPPDARIPSTFAKDAQDALDGIFSECLADKICGSAFPDVKRDLMTVLARLDREPVRVRVTDSQTGAPVDITISRSAFAQVIRYMMYRPSSASAVPHHVHAAASGDFVPLGRTAISLGIGGGISFGFYLSSTCGEDLPWFTDAEAAAQSAGTFLGDYRVRQQRDACAAWPGAKLPAGYLEPVRSDVPVLILVGERDPVTPPRWGREIVEHLTQGRLVVVPGGGHSLRGLQNEECLTRLRTEFLEGASVERLPTDCVAEVRRPAFLGPPG